MGEGRIRHGIAGCFPGLAELVDAAGGRCDVDRHSDAGDERVAVHDVGLLSTRLNVSAQAERWLSPVIGLATGIVNGATGVSVMPLVPHLSSLGLQREALIQAMGLVPATPARRCLSQLVLHRDDRARRVFGHSLRRELVTSATIGVE
jgi:hypothetical protein